jgi:hypothetical protein
MSTRPQRTEAQIEAACDRIIAQAKGSIVMIGRGKVDHSPGLPSRRYHVHGRPMWWAPRSPRGHLSRATSELLTSEYSMGQLVGAGDDDALRHVVNLLAGDHFEAAVHRAWQYFRTVADRGMVGRAS